MTIFGFPWRTEQGGPFRVIFYSSGESVTTLAQERDLSILRNKHNQTTKLWFILTCWAHPQVVIFIDHLTVGYESMHLPKQDCYSRRTDTAPSWFAVSFSLWCILSGTWWIFSWASARWSSNAKVNHKSVYRSTSLKSDLTFLSSTCDCS